ncbi:glycosyltransferase family 4 protein [Corynebacterium sp. P5848]|uniref:glycosyltransferase family 4 protein n=1 Tax=Corynebacterium marambiense TaxID=2765364 RepID=UPI00226102D8|nr:glycosyltransferase family 4 protein [Corynebacterium marambiense]MCX7542901.1 glycosyltransferase family 4 protein [Corynebacterium marambiense]
MHILLISQYWEPEQGVVQRRWQWISSALIEAGHELTVVCPPPHYPGGKLISEDPLHQTGAIDDSSKGLRIYRSAFREHTTSLISRIEDQGIIMLSQLLTARRAVRDARRGGNPVDVVCCTVPALPSAAVGYAVSRILRLPLVVELRDAWPEILEYIDEWKDPQPSGVSVIRRTKIAVFHMLLLAAGKVLTQILRRAEAIITTSESLAKLKRTDAKGEVVAVRNRAHAEAPHNATPDPPRSGPLRILYAGTVGRAQGLENAVKALALAQQNGAEVEMRIAGGGAHLDSVKHLAKSQGLPIEFLGRIPFETVIQQYEWADTALVHLQSWSPMNYTIPSKLFEAMQLGKHVSAAVSGEAAEIVECSGVGDVVRPMRPEELAQLWFDLWKRRERLDVSGRGEAWFTDDHRKHDLAGTWVSTVERITR